jgi:hypothetical protein
MARRMAGWRAAWPDGAPHDRTAPDLPAPRATCPHRAPQAGTTNAAHPHPPLGWIPDVSRPDSGGTYVIRPKGMGSLD